MWVNRSYSVKHTVACKLVGDSNLVVVFKNRGKRVGIPVESANRRYRFSAMVFLMSLHASASSPVQSKHLGWLDMVPVAVKLV